MVNNIWTALGAATPHVRRAITVPAILRRPASGSLLSASPGRNVSSASQPRGLLPGPTGSHP